MEITWREFRNQYIECGKVGNRFTFADHRGRDIIFCMKFKTYCHSAACRTDREDITEDSDIDMKKHTDEDCWCEPELDYEDPDTGNQVWVHRRLQ